MEAKLYQITCLYCSSKVLVRSHKKKDRYCSRKCGATAANIARGPRSERTKNKISDSINNTNEVLGRKVKNKVCPVCLKEFKPRPRSICCSNSCAAKYKWLDPSFRNRVSEYMKNADHKGWKTRKNQSYPEKFWENALISKGISDFDIERVFKHSDLGLNTRSCYRVDFYFEDIKLALEIDGSQHRKHEDRIKSDRIRNKAMRDNGILIFRVPWYGANTESKLDTLFKQIDNFVDIYNSLKSECKSAW